jgi:antitoxin MazE
MSARKWGNSLALRLPAAVVEALGLKKGNEISIAGKRDFEVALDGWDDTRCESAESLQRSLCCPRNRLNLILMAEREGFGHLRRQ